MAGVFLSFTGCGGGIREQTFELAPQPTAVEKVKSLLERYQAGAQPGSEMGTIKDLINDMKEQSPDSVANVEKIFDKLNARPDQAKAIATQALKSWPE